MSSLGPGRPSSELIQFRSKSVDEHGQALGYQADLGYSAVCGNLWGKLYHDHGRGKLDWKDHRTEAV